MNHAEMHRARVIGWASGCDCIDSAYVRAAIAALLAAMYELTAWKAVSVVSARAVRIAWPVRTDPLTCAPNHA
jgi:hypothetical protein